MLERNEAVRLNRRERENRRKRLARATTAALAFTAVAGLWPKAAKAQVIVGIPQSVLIIDQPAPAYGSYPVFTFPSMTTYSSGFTFGVPFDFNPVGTLPAGFTYGGPIPPQGYYDWAGAPPPSIDIGPSLGTPVITGIPVPVNPPFVTTPAPPVAPVAPAPAQPAIPDSAFIQHGPPRIIVKVGRTDKSRSAPKGQNKPKTSSSSRQTPHKQKPSG